MLLTIKSTIAITPTLALLQTKETCHRQNWMRLSDGVPCWHPTESCASHTASTLAPMKKKEGGGEKERKKGKKSTQKKTQVQLQPWLLTSRWCTPQQDGCVAARKSGILVKWRKPTEFTLSLSPRGSQLSSLFSAVPPSSRPAGRVDSQPEDRAGDPPVDRAEPVPLRVSTQRGFLHPRLLAF